MKKKVRFWPRASETFQKSKDAVSSEKMYRLFAYCIFLSKQVPMSRDLVMISALEVTYWFVRTFLAFDMHQIISFGVMYFKEFNFIHWAMFTVGLALNVLIFLPAFSLENSFRIFGSPALTQTWAYLMTTGVLYILFTFISRIFRKGKMSLNRSLTLIVMAMLPAGLFFIVAMTTGYISR